MSIDDLDKKPFATTEEIDCSLDSMFVEHSALNVIKLNSDIKSKTEAYFALALSKAHDSFPKIYDCLISLSISKSVWNKYASRKVFPKKDFYSLEMV